MRVPKMGTVVPSVVKIAGRSVTLCELDTICVSAKAIFIVPSVTMNGGSFTRVTSRPLRRPPRVVVPIPAAIATGPDIPAVPASNVMVTPPSAMSIPHERSIPAVRITSV